MRNYKILLRNYLTNKNVKAYIFTILLCTSIASCKDKSEVQFPFSGVSLTIDNTLKPDSSIIAIYHPYQLGLDSIMNEVLCYSTRFLEKSNPESSLSNWMADVCLNSVNKSYKVDFCLLNYGGIRSTLPKGAVTTKNIFQIMPFENELVIIEIPDSSFTKSLEYLKHSHGHPISGIKLKIKDDTITHSLLSRKSVRILTSDYLANGGDQMSFFADSIRMIKTNLKIRDVLLAECKAVDTLHTTFDNRFIYE